MAHLYQAELRPSKLELLTAWLPTRAWHGGPLSGELIRVSAFRFDDPAGQVGIETMLVRSGDGPVIQVPLTYRGAPLNGADRFLVGTMEHSVLGRRWIYDGCGDPVYAGVLAAAIFTGGTQAEEFIEVDGQLRRREPAMSVSGSGKAQAPAVEELVQVDDGDPALMVADTVELTVARVLSLPGNESGPSGALTLTGVWSGQSSPALLAYARAR
ncbi:hypothetical protein Rhe02_82730 [Rhizocola hellebori]|uniref:Maltokinase N-terminal cap domain-containing protein n=1 Tax=Rhizocola hellebori TaxID=1392758 RepID=A0A8J3QJB3_9ACTN|nr:hypothetical protein [Rhizocola hellebori]GIH10206.1 hypothetical protein Rhe02_82730 [Rhizocola hellebori]